MSHREGRIIHDADSHIIEARGWLESYASEYVKNNLETGAFDLNMSALDPLMNAANKRLAGADPDLTEALRSNIFAHPGKRNMWSAYGAVEKVERSAALDIMGVSSQLIFPRWVLRGLRAQAIWMWCTAVAMHLIEEWQTSVRMIHDYFQWATCHCVILSVRSHHSNLPWIWGLMRFG